MRKLALAFATLMVLASCGSTAQNSGQVSVSGDELAAPVAEVAADGIDGTVESTETVGGGPTAAGTARTAATTAAGTARTATTTARPASIPATGKGWDQKTVFIGVNTQKDVQAAASSVGVSNLDGGDQEGQVRAVIDELNRRGGLFGRKLQAVFRDHSTVATASDPNSVGAATCTYFTQDRPVIAVFSPITLMDVPSFRACFSKAKVPLFSASVATVDTAAAKALDPYFYQSVAPAYDYLVGPFIQRLTAQGWFGGWNTATGSSGPAPAKVGVIVKDDEVGVRVAAMLSKAISAAGHPGTEVYRYAEGQSDFSPAVLQFRGRDVTHLIIADSSSLPFAIAANNQGYRPRWGVTSFNAPWAFLETNARNQMAGALGVGWSPSLDVADARDPGDTTPAETECKSILAKGGQTFGGKRLAEAVGFAFCDGLKLIVEGAVAGRGLSGPAISTGIQTIAPRFGNAFSFATGLGPGRLFLPGAVRDLGWDPGCGCFRYKSATNIKL